jgi:hypothetical protein
MSKFQQAMLAAKQSATAIFLTFLASCATQNTPLPADARKSIKTIVLIEVPEPTSYELRPEQTSGGLIFMAGGALGGLIFGSIEAGRVNAATKRFTEALQSANLDLSISSALLNELESGLGKKGYSVRRAASDGAAAQIVLSQPADSAATLSLSLAGGYAIDPLGASPNVRVSATLVKAGQRIFSNSYWYTLTTTVGAVKIVPNPKFVPPSLDEMFSNLEIVANGLNEGGVEIAKQICREL